MVSGFRLIKLIKLCYLSQNEVIGFGEKWVSLYKDSDMDDGPVEKHHFNIH